MTLLLIVLVLIAIRTEITVNHTIDGIELGKMQDKVKDLDTQNMLLQTKLEQQTSLQTIDQKAKQMGFVEGR